jgi:hypothetical protein
LADDDNTLCPGFSVIEVVVTLGDVSRPCEVIVVDVEIFPLVSIFQILLLGALGFHPPNDPEPLK